MKKILIVSTVSRQFYLFEQGNIEVLNSLGYEVHGAANFEDTNKRLDSLEFTRHPFDIQRSPFSLKNIKAYIQLKKIMKSEEFDAVHCHSPMGGVLARLAAKAIGVKTVIYTAHGFHFYKGAPIINWLLYYPIEKWLSKYTDILITINEEDFKRAEHFGYCKAKYVPGIGVDTEKFSINRELRAKKRKELNIPEDAYVILSVGELNKNKNHEVVIKAISRFSNKNIIYLICGEGVLREYLTKIVSDLTLTNQVRLLGFRNDINEIYSVADLFAFPSYREGLSVSLMEAMASGLPIVCSNIRGNKDIVEQGLSGYLLAISNVEDYYNAIVDIMNDNRLSSQMSLYNISHIKKFDKQEVKSIMQNIYRMVNNYELN